jgi:site-specific recombinase XerD
VSEVLALRPSSFQVESGIVAIETLKRRKHCVREVPIPPELMAAINGHFKLSVLQRGEQNSRLWPWHRVTAWRMIKQVMLRCSISGRKACPRGLRHAFGVGSLQAGVPLNLAQRWLGHARISTTAIYAAASGAEELFFIGRFWHHRNDPPKNTFAALWRLVKDFSSPLIALLLVRHAIPGRKRD